MHLCNACNFFSLYISISAPVGPKSTLGCMITASTHADCINSWSSPGFSVPLPRHHVYYLSILTSQETEKRNCNSPRSWPLDNWVHYKSPPPQCLACTYALRQIIFLVVASLRSCSHRFDGSLIVATPEALSFILFLVAPRALAFILFLVACLAAVVACTFCYLLLPSRSYGC